MDQARLMEVLGEVLDLPREDRAGFLTEHCADDPELRREVERLLALEGDTAGFLDQPVHERRRQVDTARREAGERSEAIRQIGPYRVVETIFEGGMGIVYLAERDGDFEKQVAIKVLRRELATEAVVRRFHGERQILARLEHPSIARLIDGGSLKGGQPYLVMEYVEGTPVDAYCADHDLGLKQRLQLFLKICSAVAYAHRNLIVHRDLKPANILVTADGRPKLLDFGIAKLLDPADDLLKDVTATAARPMTLRYASPEQILGEAITTATDVWALGLLLCKLLAGQLPFEQSPLVVFGAPGKRPELRVNEARPEPPSRLAVRRKLRRRLAGDLDAIVLRALGRAPSDRYASVERMAADVENHLGRRPVAARRGGWLYRTARQIRRRPGMTLAVTLIVAASVFSTVLWRQALAEQHRADRERAVAVRAQTRAERVSEFLKDLFKAADPNAAKGGKLMVREVLDTGRRRLAAGLEGEPELEAELAGTLGDVYREMGLWDDAIVLLERAVELRRGLYPEGDPRLAVALNDLASGLYYRERYAEAEALLRESLGLRRRFGAEPPQIARALNNLASALKQRGELDAAGELYEEALAIRETALGGEDPSVAASLYSLGSLRQEQGDPAAAEPLLRRSLEIYLATHGEGHTRVASVLSTLGRVLHDRGENVAAADLLRRAVEIRRRLLGADHPHVTWAEEALAAVLADANSAGR